MFQLSDEKINIPHECLSLLSSNKFYGISFEEGLVIMQLISLQSSRKVVFKSQVRWDVPSSIIGHVLDNNIRHEFSEWLYPHLMFVTVMSIFLNFILFGLSCNIL